MVIDDFNKSIDNWISLVSQSSFDRLCAKPSATSWSLGQVCMHLLEATGHYLGEINSCLSNRDHVIDEMSQHAKVMFHNNAFPDELIEGPASNADTPQAKNKEALLGGLKTLREEINAIAVLISASASKGKTKHPGLNYFNASEWFQFAEMHFRHHTRQRKRIEEFLETCARIA